MRSTLGTTLTPFCMVSNHTVISVESERATLTYLARRGARVVLHDDPSYAQQETETRPHRQILPPLQHHSPPSQHRLRCYAGRFWAGDVDR